MAPELAIRELRRLKGTRTVLDPMAGSGTVLREASDRGHTAVGYDLDPLAVLMARVWTTPVQDALIKRTATAVIASVGRAGDVVLPWIDNDEETLKFTRYWFGLKQRRVLRRIAWAICSRLRTADPGTRRALDVLQLALSRIVVTKDSGASLGRDVSHSRPHRVWDASSYDVLDGFERSVRALREALSDEPPTGGVTVRCGDARRLRLKPGSVDLVLTSPPYLNAIDYLRGHRLSLVWLGYSMQKLRKIRAESIGAERALETAKKSAAVLKIRDAMVLPRKLEARHVHMVERYAFDVAALMAVTKRVLAPKGRAVLVVGNSCLRKSFIRNSAGVTIAGKLAGLRLVGEAERELPESRRYLPLRESANAALEKRMRTESVLTFARVED
jgi:SAM-dependent methyltransferase